MRLRGVVLVAALGMAPAGAAVAFPLVDPTGEQAVPEGTALAAPDAADLRNQLQIVNGLAAPMGGGWTFVPRFDFQEMFTDNELEQHSPRQWDMVSYFSPGFSLAGAMPRVVINLNYTPTLALYARSSSLDALTQSLNGLASITVVPDFAFVDLRAVSGVHSAYGGIGGIGGVGGTTVATAQAAIPVLAGNAQGLNRDNEVQSTSLGISPYLFRQFGDWGSARLGESFNVTRSDTLSGFAAPPIPTGGSNAQTLISNEQNLHLVTGNNLERFQDAFDADLLNNRTNAEAGSIDAITGEPITVPNQSSSSRTVASDTVTYQVTRSISVFASAGHEDITYSGVGAQSIHDMIWSLGTTLIPNPDSRITVSYGHQNGYNSFTANGYYAVTAMTVLTVSYGSTLGTQLENLQTQLNAAASGNNGTLVNGQTGGALFGAINALPVEDGVFRTDTLAVGAQTTRGRDVFTLNLVLTKETTTGSATTTWGEAKTFTGTWVRSMRPDMIVNAAVSYSLQDQSVADGQLSGASTSAAVSLGWQWQLSDTLSVSLRYSFIERQSAVAANAFYQNLLILGISKTF